MPASGPPEWGPDDTGGVPVGPEPEPTGAAGSGQGPGGWGGKPRVEPFAVAAMVWAVVSIVLPILGTIVALVLSTRAADSIRRSHGTRSGTQLVTAARITAGAVIALWAIGLVAFVALGGNEGDNSKVAVPTQPPSTVTSLGTSTTTTTRPTSTTVSTTRPAGTTSTVLAPTVVTVSPPPPSTPPTSPPITTAAPTAPTTSPTTAPTVPPTTTTIPGTTTTTRPGEAEERRITTRLLRPQRLGPSNRGVPNSERAVVQYVPGGTVTVTWAIDNGEPPLPTGTPTCAPGPPTTSTTTTSTSTSTSTSTTTTTTSTSTTTTTLAPGQSTAEVARQEAVTILRVLRTEIVDDRLDVSGIQLIGRYPIEGGDAAGVDVVQVFYYESTVVDGVPSAAKVFVAPPAGEVQCLNPAFT